MISQIHVRCYFETTADEIDIDSMECVAAEVAADFCEHGIDVEYLTIDLSQPVNNQSILSQKISIYDRSTWILMRKEFQDC